MGRYGGVGRVASTQIVILNEVKNLRTDLIAYVSFLRRSFALLRMTQERRTDCRASEIVHRLAMTDLKQKEKAPDFSGAPCILYSASCQSLQTSTQPSKREYRSSSAIVSSMALLLLPQAGKTVSNRLSDSSR